MVTFQIMDLFCRGAVLKTDLIYTKLITIIYEENRIKVAHNVKKDIGTRDTQLVLQKKLLVHLLIIGKQSLFTWSAGSLKSFREFVCNRFFLNNCFSFFFLLGN